MKTKYKIILVFFSLLLLVHFPLLYGLNKNSEELQESTHIRFVYEATQLATRENQPFLVVDTMALDVEGEGSVFYDMSRSKRDSLETVNIKKTKKWNFTSDKEELEKRLEAVGAAAMTTRDREGETARWFKNRLKQEVITLDRDDDLLYKFQVTEVLSFDWEITSDTTTILGYSCQKATTHFRGRDYIAWFALDLPIDDGPWKFHGLPGMILRVEDSESIFQFKVIGFEKITSAPISYASSVFKAKEMNYKQLNTLRQNNWKTISYGFWDDSSTVTFYSGMKNPITYPDLEIE